MSKPEYVKFRWGFSSLGAPDLDLTALAELAVRYQCPNLELRTLEGSLDLPSVLDERFPESGAARALLDRYGVEVPCLNSSFKLSDAGESEQHELIRWVHWARELGAPYIRVFGGGRWGEELPSEAWDRIRANLQWWREMKEREGWPAELVLETHDAFSGSGPCLELFERVGQPLPLIWDTHHTWKFAGETPQQTWQTLGPQVCHLHIKDSVSRPSQRHPYTYVPFDEGEMPWRDVLDIVGAAGYEGVVSIEWEKQWHPYLAPLETMLEKARQRGIW